MCDHDCDNCSLEYVCLESLVYGRVPKVFESVDDDSSEGFLLPIIPGDLGTWNP